MGPQMISRGAQTAQGNHSDIGFFFFPLFPEKCIPILEGMSKMYQYSVG